LSHNAIRGGEGNASPKLNDVASADNGLRRQTHRRRSPGEAPRGRPSSPRKTLEFRAYVERVFAWNEGSIGPASRTIVLAWNSPLRKRKSSSIGFASTIQNAGVASYPAYEDLHVQTERSIVGSIVGMCGQSFDPPADAGDSVADAPRIGLSKLSTGDGDRDATQNVEA
jgi:hypothetical protein